MDNFIYPMHRFFVFMCTSGVFFQSDVFYFFLQPLFPIYILLALQRFPTFHHLVCILEWHFYGTVPPHMEEFQHSWHNFAKFMKCHLYDTAPPHMAQFQHGWHTFAKFMECHLYGTVPPHMAKFHHGWHTFAKLFTHDF